MTNIMLSGCLGRMGKAITEIVKDMEDVSIVCGFDVTETNVGYPVYNTYESVLESADVIIDFSHPSNFQNILNFAKTRKIPIVVSTTGLSDEQRQELLNAKDEIPVFFSANMSLGINLLISLSKQAAKILDKTFDIEIIEKHHNQKLDAPSGTALAIADAIKETLSHETEYVYDRHSVRKKRDKNEIGLHAVRGGTIVGEHDVLFAGPNETITISHSAQSREVFAQGAIRAAEFLKGKPAGFYSMDDLFREIL